ncbi:MAG TPA: class I SAM-dependent methyltransferase [Ferruginibacter sp.]|jgi:2-polyprenyl-3-methyl-5-hydroxy-6-metoxy-1,4-benzoquinol methylase|nr:class I SAM-dependent methyltransferase [Ferruginibacter sp.]
MMQESLLPLLRCPVTTTPLSIQVLKRADKIYDGNTVNVIEEAILYATEDWFYPVIKGVPRLYVEAFLDHEAFFKTTGIDYPGMKARLVEKNKDLIQYAVKKNKRTKESFSKEWSVYNYDTDKTWDADNDAMIQRFLTETDETVVNINSKLIFDAGCGNGKLDSLLAATGAIVIAMDFANSIEQAYERNQFTNAHFVQGDVQYPPLISGGFDIVHCSGVLIHTNNAELSFSCIERQVKVGGKLSVWLYHPGKDFIHKSFNFIRRYTSRLPLRFQYYLYAVTIFPVSYCIKKLKGNKQNSREMMVDILDWFTPEFRSEHEHDEVRGWYQQKNYKNIRVTTVNKFGFNIVGEK